MRVAKLSGRGVYTNDELENWLYKAMDIGIYQVDIWYFIVTGLGFESRDVVCEPYLVCPRVS
jgi:hypothetical protein